MASAVPADDKAHDFDPWVEDPSAYRILFEPSARRVRVAFAGETVADSRRTMVLLESRHLPVYYFPEDDVRMDLFERTEHHSRCPFKGDATYWTLRVGERQAENALWSYLDPLPQAAAMKGYLAFYWNRVDHWYEEDEEVFVHPRDPYKRVDVIASERTVRVVLGGETVAESSNARFLFETGLPTRYYLPPNDVRMDLLEPTDKGTRCPYKGEAVYWSARVGGKAHENIVWSYPQPIPECPRIEGLLCFFNEHVDAIRIDGEEVPKVKTPWS